MRPTVDHAALTGRSALEAAEKLGVCATATGVAEITLRRERFAGRLGREG